MPLLSLWAASGEQRDIDHVEPAKNAMNDRPEDRVVVGIGDGNRKRRAKPHAVFRALDPNPVVAISVHGDPFGLWGRRGGMVGSVLRRNLTGKLWNTRSLSSGAHSRDSQLSSPAKAGDPVRRDFSVQQQLSLEYWVARSSRAM